MNLFHAILLGLIQDITEFLSVSSTAHLTLVFKWSIPLAFDGLGALS